MSHKELSLDDFKRWMRHHSDDVEFSTTKTTNPLIGISVTSKIGADRLVLKMTEASSDYTKLAEEFSQYGGTISDVNDKTFLIEVKSGTFYIHRGYVTRR